MLTGVALFLLAIIALLAIPVTLTYQLAWQQAMQGKITLRWMFGLVRFQITPAESRIAGAEQAQSRPKKTRKTSSKSTFSPIAALRQKAFRQRLFRFVRDFWRAIHKHNIKLRIRIGLGDPADTGRLWAIVGPVSAMLATVRDVSIEIRPDFIDTVFELDSSGSIRIIPLQLIVLTVGLFLSPSVWQGLKHVRNAG